MQKHRIKHFRTQAGLTQQQVADHLGMSVANYSKIERNTLEITLTNIVSLADLFQVSLSKLAGWVKYEKTETPEELFSIGLQLIKRGQLIQIAQLKQLLKVANTEQQKKELADLFLIVSTAFNIPLESLEHLISLEEKALIERYEDNN